MLAMLERPEFRNFSDSLLNCRRWHVFRSSLMRRLFCERPRQSLGATMSLVCEHNTERGVNYNAKLLRTFDRRPFGRYAQYAAASQDIGSTRKNETEQGELERSRESRGTDICSAAHARHDVHGAGGVLKK